MIQLTYSGSSGSFSVDIEIGENRSIRMSLPRGVTKTVEGFGYGELAGHLQWEALIARTDITLALTGADQQRFTYSAVCVAGAAGASDDVALFASAPFNADIVGTRVAVGTGVASTVFVVRDAASGYATADYGAGTALLRLTAKRPGAYGETITFEIVDTGGAGPATCTVLGTDITVDLVGLTRTAAQVKTLVDGTAAAAALVSVATPNGAGAGNVAVTAQAPLAAGDAGTDLSLDMSVATSNSSVDGTKPSQVITKGERIVVWRQDRSAAGEVYLDLRRTG